ncbi:hypothetical protein PFISCL1PPCAC_3922, partial [Pristionchus fissidentatus]
QYEKESVPLREQNVGCRVYMPLTDLERLVVTDDNRLIIKSKPLTTIQIAVLLRKLFGEDLNAKQRNSITAKTIESYAKAASAICLVPSVVILMRMPLLLFTLISNIMTRFNEGHIKVFRITYESITEALQFAEKEITKHSAYHLKGIRDFHNTRFLQLARISYAKAPNRTESILHSLSQGEINVNDASEKLSNAERPLHECCRKKKNEAMISDEQIANELFPEDLNSHQKFKRILRKLRSDSFDFSSRHLSAVKKTITKIAESETSEIVEEITELDRVPDVSFVNGYDTETLKELQEVAARDGDGVSLLYFLNVDQDIPDEMIRFSTYEDKDEFDNEHAHVVTAIHIGSGETAKKERVWEELKRRQVPIRKGMPHSTASFETLATGSKNVLLKSVKKSTVFEDPSKFT